MTADFISNFRKMISEVLLERWIDVVQHVTGVVGERCADDFLEGLLTVEEIGELERSNLARLNLDGDFPELDVITVILCVLCCFHGNASSIVVEFHGKFALRFDRSAKEVELKVIMPLKIELWKADEHIKLKVVHIRAVEIKFRIFSCKNLFKLFSPQLVNLKPARSS